MEFLSLLYTVLLVAICLLQALLLYRSGKQAPRQDDEALKEWVRQQLDAQSKLFAQKQAELARQNYDAMRGISETLQTAVQGMSSTLNAGQAAQQQTMEQRLQGLEASNARKLEEMRKTLAESMAALQAQNAQKLDEIRCTVDEQLQDALQKRVTESFKAVNAQLEQVYKGLGEMQSLAADVGGLKQVLSGVKTRGILGEIQLGAILEEILAPEQYDTNVATIPGSAQRVEYAIKMPGADGGSVWLPIDSKFPGDTYEHLRDAIEAGDAEGVAAARRALEQVIKAEAKDISSKYLSVPETTNFAIMFLPFEGLYAEVVDRPGLIECLQRDYQVNIAGPSTMAVILNSLQMSYQTFAFQRRADEIQRVLSAVKAEFPKYQAELRRALRQIETAGKTVDGIINTRTNVIERKLKSVTAMEDEFDIEIDDDKLMSINSVAEAIDAIAQTLGE